MRRMGLSGQELLRDVLLPAMAISLVVTGLAFAEHEHQVQQREAPIRKEIAQNFAQKWGRCDLAAKFDPSVSCNK